MEEHGKIFLKKSFKEWTKITWRAHQRFIQKVTEEPRTTTEALQASLPSVNVNEHDLMISNREDRKDFDRRVLRQKAGRLKENKLENLTFSKTHVDNHKKNFRGNISWTD